MKRFLLIILLSLPFLHLSAQEQHHIFIQRTTDILCLVPSTTGLVKAILEKDKKGALQLGLSTGTTLIANFALEKLITKERPDGLGNHAFPSTHTAIAFDGASFLMRRYGWKWGVPAYAVSAYVAWGRIFTKRHDVWDVLAGAALGAGCAFIYTRPFAKNKDISISPIAYGRGGLGGGLDITYRF